MKAVLFLVSTYLVERLLQNLASLKTVRIFALIFNQSFILIYSFSTIIPFLLMHPRRITLSSPNQILLFTVFICSSW